ncbi:MAG: Trm112 family protein [Acidobacteriaceae bacterium]
MHIETALGMLACPVCHAALLYLDKEALKQEAVLCSGCGRRYPIREGLPVLLAEAAYQ